LGERKGVVVKVLGAVILGIIILVVSSIIAIMGIGLMGSTDSMFGIAFLTHTGMLALSVLIAYFLTKGNLSEYRFKIPSEIQWGRIILLGLSLGVIIAFIRILLAEGAVGNFEDNISIEIILGIWIYASIAEEVFTRGLIQGYLNTYTESGIRLSSVFLSIPVLVGAFFFGFMHLATLTLGLDIITVIATVISAIFVGIIAGYYCEKTGSLLPAILIHTLFNITGSLVAVLFLSI
jgi:membrane protease YdiL (CAAX protease family)